MKTLTFISAAGFLAFAALSALATENVPHTPFGAWADVLTKGKFQAGITYQESEAYHFWAGGRRHEADFRRKGEHYGIDINQGYVTFQYGLNDRWTADLALGYTTLGWRYFSNDSANGSPSSTTGLMDTSFGVRYQIAREGEGESAWIPTLTFRAGAVLPGSYDSELPFAPGNSSAAIEPEFILRKQIGWPGFGVYADGLFRWNRTKANDQYIVSTGFFQKIANWELNAGYRRLGTINGDSIQFDPDTRYIIYPSGVRENNSSIEAGFSYTTKKRQILLSFYSRTVFDGSNTDKKFWIGGAASFPFQLSGSNR